MNLTKLKQLLAVATRDGHSTNADECIRFTKLLGAELIAVVEAAEDLYHVAHFDKQDYTGTSIRQDLCVALTALDKKMETV